MKLSLLFVITFLIATSCCKSEFKGELKFSKEDLAVNPYTGIEEIRFVDDTGKIILYNNGLRSVIESDYQEHQGIACSDYFVIQEEDKTTFHCSDPKSLITISIVNKTNPFTTQRVSPDLRITWENSTTSPAIIQYFADIPVDSLRKSIGESNIFRDTLKLRDRRFRNVFVFPGQRDYINTDNRDTLYFSMNSGLIALKFVNGKLWVVQ
ncbi:MAG: hypothetical protein ACM3ME_05510 [Chloroflexota bacterium]|nr:hypothetical protein [Lentimicrobium sp.]